MLESGAWLILPGCKLIAFISPYSFSLARSSVLASFHFEEHDSFDGLYRRLAENRHFTYLALGGALECIGLSSTASRNHSKRAPECGLFAGVRP
jgi:hypothetical protein